MLGDGDAPFLVGGGDRVLDQAAGLGVLVEEGAGNTRPCGHTAKSNAGAVFPQLPQGVLNVTDQGCGVLTARQDSGCCSVGRVSGGHLVVSSSVGSSSRLARSVARKAVLQTRLK